MLWIDVLREVWRHFQLCCEHGGQKGRRADVASKHIGVAGEETVGGEPINQCVELIAPQNLAPPAARVSRVVGELDRVDRVNLQSGQHSEIRVIVSVDVVHERVVRAQQQCLLQIPHTAAMPFNPQSASLVRPPLSRGAAAHGSWAREAQTSKPSSWSGKTADLLPT